MDLGIRSEQEPKNNWRLREFQISASNDTHFAIASQECAVCVLHTVQHALTACSVVQPPVHLRPASFAYKNTNSARVHCTHAVGTEMTLWLCVVGRGVLSHGQSYVDRKGRIFFQLNSA